MAAGLKALAPMETETGWSRELLYQLVDSVREYAIFTADPDGRIASWNIGAQHMFGYAPKEAIGQDSDILFTPEDRAENIPEKERVRARKSGVAEDKRWHIRKDGSYFFVSGVQTAIYDNEGKHTGYAKITRDLTERLKLQEELRAAFDSLGLGGGELTSQLSNPGRPPRPEAARSRESGEFRTALLKRIVATQEAERRKVAREINDHLGQQMTALKLKLDYLAVTNRIFPELSARIGEIQKLANQVDSDLDFLALELNSSALDDLGFAAAVEKYVRGWSERFKVAAEFQQVGMISERLMPEIEINLYRILQEAMNNVAKHAQAKKTSVLLEKKDDDIRLIIEDDGIGFHPDSKPAKSDYDHPGLVAMKERSELFGGNIQIESSPGHGTTIFVEAPAKYTEAEA